MGRLREVSDKALTDGRKLLIPYLVAGDPSLGATEKLMHQLDAPPTLATVSKTLT